MIDKIDDIKNTKDILEKLKQKINIEILKYVETNIQSLLKNKFNRSVVYDIYYNSNNIQTLYNILINEEKDSSFYLYMGLIFYKKNNVKECKKYLQGYLKLTQNLPYETVNAEQTKFIQIAENLINN